MKVFFHVDLDAFYAAVEVVDDPELKGKPVIVGALPGHRGVVSSCSYEARGFGVRSAMPVSQAVRRCPQGVFLPVRMARYAGMSDAVMRILAGFTPELQQISIDEAFLDMSGTERLFGAPPEAGGRIKQEVLARTGLTLSVGIAANKYMAKLASERSKPDGLLVVIPGQELSFLDDLPLEKLWGVGARTLQRLGELGVTTVQSLRGMSESGLSRIMGEAGARYLCRVSRGIDPGIYSADPKSHSVSTETTFEHDTDCPETLRRVLLELSQELMQRLIRERLTSDTVVLKLRFFDFRTTTAQKNLGHRIASSDELLETARRLLAERWDGTTPVRLIGLGAANVASRASREIQGELFEDPSQKRQKVDEAVSALRQEISGVRITRASLLDGPKRRGPTKRPGTSGEAAPHAPAGPRAPAEPARPSRPPGGDAPPNQG